MNKKKYIIIPFILFLFALLGIILGINKPKKENIDNDTIVKTGIEEAFRRSVYESEDGQISNIRLACHNNKRYLYVFEYDFWDSFQNEQDKDTWAIEMIIDKQTEFYYIQNLERYYNRYNDKCINLYE